MESQIDPRVLRRSNTHAADFVRKTNFDIDRIVPAMNTQTFQQELEQIIHKRDDSGATCSFLSTDGQSLQDDLSDLGYDSENFYREQAQFIYEKGSNKRNTIQESYEFSNFDEIENQDRLAEDSMLVDTLSDISHGDAAEFAGQILQPSVLDRKFVCVEAYEPSHPLELRLNVGDIVQGVLTIKHIELYTNRMSVYPSYMHDILLFLFTLSYLISVYSYSILELYSSCIQCFTFILVLKDIEM